MLPRAGPVPVGDGWAFEVKFDGMRLQVRRDGGAVCLRSRQGRACTEEFPELAPIQSALGRRKVLLDGELVCLGPDGSPDFASLRRRLRAPADEARRHAERWPVTYLPFDLLHLDGRSTRELPYERRRELLLDLALDDGPGWRPPRHFVGDSEQLLAATRQHGLDGSPGRWARGSGRRRCDAGGSSIRLGRGRLRERHAARRATRAAVSAAAPRTSEGTAGRAPRTSPAP